MPRRYSRELQLQIVLTEVPLECQNLDRAKDRFDRARKQEPVQIFAKAEDSRDPAVVYAQAKWSESYVKLRVGLQTPLAAAGRFPVARWALLSEESIECIGFHKCISQSPCDSWNRLKSN